MASDGRCEPCRAHRLSPTLAFGEPSEPNLPTLRGARTCSSEARDAGRGSDLTRRLEESSLCLAQAAAQNPQFGAQRKHTLCRRKGRAPSSAMQLFILPARQDPSDICKPAQVRSEGGV